MGTRPYVGVKQKVRGENALQRPAKLAQKGGVSVLFSSHALFQFCKDSTKKEGASWLGYVLACSGSAALNGCLHQTEQEVPTHTTH